MTKFTVGTEIVLSREKGPNKRIFNGKMATVVRAPKKGSWMTVRVVQDGAVIKWRKGGCVKVERKTDPLKYIGEEMMVYVLTFLGGGGEKDTKDYTDRKQLLWFQDGKKLYHQLASVSTSWRSLCERNLSSILGVLNVDLILVESSTVIKWIQWLCRYKLRLGSLFFQDATLFDIPLLTSLLMDCETRQLQHVQAKFVPANNSYSIWMRASHYNQPQFSSVLDLAGIDSLGEIAEANGIPVGTHMSRKDFHDVLATQCPNIYSLSLNLSLPETRTPNRFSYISAKLFSQATIVKLRLSIGFDVPWPLPANEVDGLIATKLIKKLTGLEELALSCSNHYKLITYGKRLHVESASLRSLDVTGLSKGTWVSCSCPVLERYQFNGSPYGNGSRPLPEYHQRLRNDPRFETFGQGALHRVGGQVSVYAEDVPFLGLNVPDSCEMVCECLFLEDWVIDEIQRAQFVTWNDDGDDEA